MPSIDALVECPVYDSFRVQQIAGMFDVSLADKLREKFSVEVPDTSEDWEVGLIVGPSGSGKSTIAKAAFGDSLYCGGDWKSDRSILDCFPENLATSDIVGLLTSVGFSSPPSWPKPYQVLSNGEKFRCDLAMALSRSLIESSPLIVYDEFTSVVDRTVAKIGSAAIANSIRKGIRKCRFVAVTCHYDVAEWLEPDWVVDMASQSLTRGRLRRPQLDIQIFRGSNDTWKLFAKHHYLSGECSPAAAKYVGMFDGHPVCFAGVIGDFGHKGYKRVSRIVTLPDFQGVGIGGRFLDAVAAIEYANGHTLRIRASHPSVINHCKRSVRWKCKSYEGARFRKHTTVVAKTSSGRCVASFEYVPES